MSLQQTTSRTEMFRYRIREIKLIPQTSSYDILIELYVDGKRAHKLPKIQKGQDLIWRDLCVPCDLIEGSAMTVHVTEVHRRKDLIGQVRYSVVQGANPDTLSIKYSDTRKQMFEAHVQLLEKEATEQLYAKALHKARRMERQPSIIQRAGKTGSAFKTLLELGRVMADLDPTGGAKVAFSTCTMAWEHLEALEKQDAKLDQLVEHLAGAMPAIEQVKNVAGKELNETVMEMLRLIEDASVFMMSAKSSTWSGRVLSSISNSTAQDQIDLFVNRFKLLRTEFNERMLAQSLKAAEIDRHRERLNELKPVSLASYDPDRQCLEGTRVGIIDDITAWACSDTEGTQLAWVHGLAGLGKSSIAASVCQRLARQSVLASSFFCKSDSPDLRDPRRLLMTIVYGLAQRWDEYAAAVVTAIKHDAEFHSKYLQPLFDTLVENPLQELGSTDRLSKKSVIVVDALDECGDVTTRRRLIMCLRRISRISGLKVVVTSRPNEDILLCFRSDTSNWFTEFDVFEYNAANDIRIYIQNCLASMSTIEGWPNDAIERVAARAGGLFIWARTACTYIVDGLDSCQQLQLVLSGTGMADIDALYTSIILANQNTLKEGDKSCLEKCLGAIVATATCSPLSIDTLTRLMDGEFSRDVLQRVIQKLSSVLYVSEKLDGVVRISHPSFMEYITTATRSKELHIDLEQQNAILAERCLKTMGSGLKFNICGLETSDRLNKDMADRDAHVNNSIPPHLRYSCVYWTRHLGRTAASNVEHPLRSFLGGPELMYWLEALSLLNKLSVAPASLLQVSEFCDLEGMQDCRTISNDAYRFVLAFYDSISSGTPHLYLSALAFAPLGSHISRRMRPLFSNLLIVRGDQDIGRTPCIRTISAGREVYSVAVSPDGRLVASGSGDGMLRIWDAETGEAVLAPFKGHTGIVMSTTFSHDGRFLVSGSSDKTIRVWDAETGNSVLAPLLGHSNWVRSVADSLDGKLLASGSNDTTIRIWNASTGESTLEPLRGHTGYVLSVAFSPDSCYVVSGSTDETVRLWDAKNGDAVLEPLRGHSDWVRCVAFSPDGKRVVSASYDHTVRIWSSKTGDELSELKDHSDWVNSVAFSPDGDHVVSGSDDKTVFVWDAKTGTLVLGPLHGHSGSVTSVTFSPGGDRIISGSDDGTIRIWDAAASISTQASVSSSTVPQVDLSAIHSVAISSDGRRVVSGSTSSKVCMWDVDTGEPVLQPLQGHSGEVLSVAFSPDDSLVASGSQDNAVRIWNAKSGELVHGPMQGHSYFVNTVAFSPNGSLSGDKTVRIWSVETGDSAGEPLTGHSDMVKSVAFSPDSRRIVSGSNDETVRIWDVETANTVLGPLAGHSDRVTCVAYAPDGHLVASGSWDCTIRVWDAQTGHAVLSPPENGPSPVYSIAFLPDSSRIISGSDDGRLRVWDTETGAMVHQPLQGHTDWVNSVAVSSDGRRIVSGSSDGTVRIWDGECYLGLTSDPPNWVLPDTQVRLQSPATEGEKLLVSSGELASWLDPKEPGWVTTPDGKPLLWLPHELRYADSSIMCIPKSKSRNQVIDFTHFVHGKAWASIKKA